MEAIKVSDNLVMTKDVLEGNEFSFSSLRNYVRLGWIDPPVLRSFNGVKAGKSLFWRRSILTRLALIQTLKSLSKTDREITVILKGER